MFLVPLYVPGRALQRNLTGGGLANYTALYCSAQYHKLHCTILYYILHCTILYYTLHCTAMHCNIHCTIHCTVLYCTIQCTNLPILQCEVYTAQCITAQWKYQQVAGSFSFQKYYFALPKVVMSAPAGFISFNMKEHIDNTKMLGVLKEAWPILRFDQ